MKMNSAFVAVSLLALASCGDQQPSQPKGQVAATLDGEEITITQLNQELGEVPGDAKTKKQAYDAVLRGIVSRKLIAQEATAQKLDQSPEVVANLLKARETVLAAALAEKLRKSLPDPSRDEAQQYVNDHPASFSQRKILMLDQLVTPPVSPELLKQMGPLKTLADVEKFFTDRKIPVKKSVGSADLLTLDAETADRLAALPPGEVFVIPSPRGLQANVVRETIVQPVDQEDAIKVATRILRQRRDAELLENKMKEVFAAGQSKVRYNTDIVSKPDPAPAAAK